MEQLNTPNDGCGLEHRPRDQMLPQAEGTVQGHDAVGQLFSEWGMSMTPVVRMGILMLGESSSSSRCPKEFCFLPQRIPYKELLIKQS